MFGIGQGEFLVILLVAVVLLGPRRLPEVARRLAQVYQVLLAWKAEFDRQLAEIRRDIEAASDVQFSATEEALKDESASTTDEGAGGPAVAFNGQADATPGYSYRDEVQLEAPKGVNGDG